MQRVTIFAQRGNTQVNTAGVLSTTLVEGSFPGCTVSVFATGTTNLATIYGDNLNPPTPKANPFTADATGSGFFYAANGTRVDIQLSGTGIVTPFTLAGDVLLDDFSLTTISPPQTVAFSATPQFDLSQADWFQITLTGNVTAPTFPNASSGAILILTIAQDATGGRSFTFPASFLRPPTIALAANAVTELTFKYDGANWKALAATGDNLTVAGDAIFKKTPWIDIRAYGADPSIADNSTAIQAAINAAITAGVPLHVPGFTFPYATTLTVNIGSVGLTMFGDGDQIGNNASALKYTGTGDAISFSNGTGFVFGHHWDNIAIVAGANATSAVHGVNPSECWFERVGIWSDGTHVFTHAWFGTGWNIIWFNDCIISSNNAATQITNCFRFTDSAQSSTASIHCNGCDTFQVTNVFNIDGAANHISDSGSWHETQDTYILINDATNTTSINGFYSRDCHLLFNGAVATYPNQKALLVTNAAGKVMPLHQVNFHGVTWFTNQVVTYPMSVTLANASSELTLGVGGNSSFQGATTGLITSSLVAATQLKFIGYGFESLNAALSALTTLIGGSSGYYANLQFNGITVPNGTGVIQARNAANSANIDLIYLDNSNNVNLGAAAIIPTAVTVPFVFTTATTGTAPLVVGSTTPVANLSLSGGAGATISNQTLQQAGSGNKVTLINWQGAAAPIVGTGADANVFSFSIPGTTMGAGKGIKVSVGWQHTTGTASVTYKCKYGATTISSNAEVGTGASALVFYVMNNPGVTNAQTAWQESRTNNAAVYTTQFATPAENSLLAVTVAFTFSVANTDQVTPKLFLIELVQ